MNWTIYEMLWKKVEKIVDHLSRRISHITWIDVLLFIVTWLMADISLMIYDLCRSLLVQDKIDRSSHRRCSVKKGVLRNSAKFTGKHLYQSFFFNKVVDLRPETLLKKRLCFWLELATTMLHQKDINAVFKACCRYIQVAKDGTNFERIFELLVAFPPAEGN